MDKFLKNFNGHGQLILNVKTEGIERRLIEKMREYSITRWFFLDLSMPYFVRFAHHAKMNDIDGFTSKNLAVRFSEFEPIEYAACFSGMAEWIWADCFSNTR
ncbi:MAG: hypothetical protein IPK68_19675 [Bdellovibrionales bacterium]|nr:hypothetical protein [Bdellovibrionales bacterium]